MRSVKKLFQKAAAFTLAAAMLAGTPMTTSAADLADIYKVVDRFGEDYGEYAPDNSATGTVTNTETYTGSGALEVDASDRIAGIMIEEADVALNLSDHKQETLHVVFVDENGTKIEDEDTGISDNHLAGLKQRFTWRTDKNTVVALEPMKDGRTDKMKVNAKAGGHAVVTVELNDYANDIHYKASVDVSVEQWATDINIDNQLLQDEAFKGDTLTLDDYVTPVPATASDEITYAVVSGDKNVTLKNGELKIKGKAGEKFQIVAMGKEVSKTSDEITISDPNPTKTFEFGRVLAEDEEERTNVWNAKKNAYTWVTNEAGDKGGLEFKVDLKDKDGHVSSDRVVSWTSKKPDIVAVEKNAGDRKGTSAKLTAKAVGKAQITVKTSSGKTGTLTVTVSAYLTNLEKSDDNPGTAYSGQTVKLNVTQKFANAGSDNFTDAGLSWEFADIDGTTAKEMAKVAKLNKKTGVLEVKPSITFKQGRGEKKVEQLAVKVTNAGKISRTIDDSQYGKNKGEIGLLENIIINLEQIDVKSISVYSNMSTGAENTPIVSSGWNGTRLQNGSTRNKTTVAVDSTRTFGVVAEVVTVNEDGTELLSTELNGEPAAKVLGWTVSNAKLAEVTKGNNYGQVKALKKGSPNVIISGSTKDARGNYKAIKATVKLNVTQPTRTLTVTTNNKDIPRKNGSVAFKAVMDKGTSTKAGDIIWTVTVNGDKNSTKTLSGGRLTFGREDKTNRKGQYTAIELPNEAGATYEIKASIPQAGISRSIRMKLVEPSYSVETSVKDIMANRNVYNLENGNKYELLTVVKKDRNDSGKAPTDSNYADVTYTVDKPGYVYISDDTITTLQTGKVRITPVSSDGKRGKAITLNITE